MNNDENRLSSFVLVLLASARAPCPSFECSKNDCWDGIWWKEGDKQRVR